MSQPTLDPTSSEAQIPSINLQAATPPASSAPGDTLVSLIRKEYRNLTQILPEIDVSEKDRETCSSKLERYKGSFAPDTDEYQPLLFFDSTSDVAELLANIVDIEKLIKAGKSYERTIHEEEDEDIDPTVGGSARNTATAAMTNLIDKGLGVTQLVWSAPLTRVDLAISILEG
ncbi:hypothetical protein JCM24511_01750 [Saitozyma sp. JCM 24511]|nr:hypothetical protein JCM24511_01750 [Saitozyma sp. JCM 24511]